MTSPAQRMALSFDENVDRDIVRGLEHLPVLRRRVLAGLRLEMSITIHLPRSRYSLIG